MKTRQLGMTLYELLLVIVVATFSIVLGFRLYESLSRDSELKLIEANVDKIFQAMLAYYQTNCDGTSGVNDGTGGLNNITTTRGTLHPLSSPGTNYSVNIQTDLINTGYLESLRTSPLIVALAGDPGTQGYVAQFNQYTRSKRVCLTSNGSPAMGANSVNCTSSSNSIGTVVTWEAQVAVKVKDAATATRYKNLLNATCSSAASGTVVVQCLYLTSGPYLVWERSPSEILQKSISTYSASMPQVKSFTQMYKTNPITSLTTGTQTANQYYLCGN